MNPHADGLYGTMLIKDKTWMILESATPAVDQPARCIIYNSVESMNNI
jgi:hypothetical protein